jgi:hypothetical protein
MPNDRTMATRARGAVVAAAAVAAAIIIAAPAEASQGVRIDLGRIDVKQHLVRGGSYRLPTIGVSNPGTERTTYRMGVSHLSGQREVPIPDSWIHWSLRQFTLAPGQTRAVAARLELPTGARPDDYAGLVEAQIVTQSKGATIGAAAAAHLTFTVDPSNLLPALWLRFSTWMSDHAPWSFLLPSLLLMSFIGVRFRRRFALRLSLERRPT